MIIAFVWFNFIYTYIILTGNAENCRHWRRRQAASSAQQKVVTLFIRASTQCKVFLKNYLVIAKVQAIVCGVRVLVCETRNSATTSYCCNKLIKREQNAEIKKPIIREPIEQLIWVCFGCVFFFFYCASGLREWALYLLVCVGGVLVVCTRRCAVKICLWCCQKLPSIFR